MDDTVNRVSTVNNSDKHGQLRSHVLPVVLPNLSARNT